MAKISVKAKRTIMIFHFKFHSLLFINIPFPNKNNDEKRNVHGPFVHSKTIAKNTQKLFEKR